MVDRVYRGEIYYVHHAEVIGSEQTGGRPVIIVSNDIGNEHSPIVEVVYLTTKEKKPLPTHVSIGSATKPSIALCEQIETVHKARLGNYVGQISEVEQKNIDKALAVSLGINLTIKTNKMVEKWIEAYSEEPVNSIADAIKNIDVTDIQETVEEKSEPLTCKEPVQALLEPEVIVRIYTERDIYKELYMDLLKSIQLKLV